MNCIDRAAGVSKGGAFAPSAPLADFFGYFLVQRQESNIDKLLSKIYPQGLLIVDDFHVENFRQIFHPQTAVDTCVKIHIWVWIKKR